MHTHMLPSLNMSAKDDKINALNIKLHCQLFSVSDLLQKYLIMPTFLTPMSQSEMKENPRKSPSVPPNSATKGEIYVSTAMLKNIKEYYLDVTKFGFHSDT